MQITEYQDGNCRRIFWNLPDRGWTDVAEHIDPFLTQAIQAIASEYRDESVEWLEINRWPDSGRLIVYPRPRGHSGIAANGFTLNCPVNISRTSPVESQARLRKRHGTKPLKRSMTRCGDPSDDA